MEKLRPYYQFCRVPETELLELLTRLEFHEGLRFLSMEKKPINKEMLLVSKGSDKLKKGFKSKS